MVIRSRDCNGVDPRIVAQMVEPAFTERDLLIVLNTEDTSGVLNTRPAAPAEPEVKTVQMRSAEAQSAGLRIAADAAAAVEVPSEIVALADELGLTVVPSPRGVECRRGPVMEFVEGSMERMHATLLMLRRRELASLLA